MPAIYSARSVLQNGQLTVGRSRKTRLLLLAAGGLLTALTVVFPSLWLLEWISLIPSLLVILQLLSDHTLRLRTLYGYGLVFFWSLYAVVFHWFIAMYPLDFAGLSPFASALVVLLGVFGLSLLQALISAAALPICALAARSYIRKGRTVAIPFLFAAAYTVFEWLQNFGWWGVPWGRLSLGQIDFGVTVRSASLLGSYFVTFLIVLVNALLAYAILHAEMRRTAALTAAGVFVLNLLCGIVLMLPHQAEESTVKVASIQGNIENKWAINSLKGIKEVYRANTLLAAEEGAKLIIWPETALPCEINDPLRTYLSSLAKEADATLLVGAIREEPTEDGGTRLYNSLYAIAPDGSFYETVYDKQKLVPFGEYVPIRDFFSAVIPPLAEVGIISDDLTKGAPGQNIETDIGTLGCMICFDSIYEEVALDAVRNGAELLCLSSNDTWFEGSAAMEMHHGHARLRAIETGRYVVRAGNSGVSSVISPTGEVVAELETMTEGYLVSEVSLRNGRTLYSVIGNAFVYLLLTCLTVFAVPSAFLSIRDRVRDGSTIRRHSRKGDVDEA